VAQLEVTAPELSDFVVFYVLGSHTEEQLLKVGTTGVSYGSALPCRQPDCCLR
jgi:hypothetical protein